jgi:hypothetical protein
MESDFEDSSSYGHAREIESETREKAIKHQAHRERATALTKRPWTEEEDQLLVKMIGEEGAQNWSILSKRMTDLGFQRMGKQCRERWYNHLDPSVSKDPWSETEDALILNMHAELGNKWTVFAEKLPGRPANSIKNHWNSTLRRRLDDVPPRKTKRISEAAEQSEVTDSPPTKKRRVRKSKVTMPETPTIVSPSPSLGHDGYSPDEDLDSTNSYESRASVSYVDQPAQVPMAYVESVRPEDKKIIHHGRTMYIHKDGTLSVVNPADGSVSSATFTSPQQYAASRLEDAHEAALHDSRVYDQGSFYQQQPYYENATMTFDVYTGYTMTPDWHQQQADTSYEAESNRVFTSSETSMTELQSSFYGGQIEDVRESWESSL